MTIIWMLIRDYNVDIDSKLLKLNSEKIAISNKISNNNYTSYINKPLWYILYF